MKPSADYSTRYSLAKRWRDAERPFLEEVYSFICPGREFDFQRKFSATRGEDTQTFVDLPEELAVDFASDMVTYFTPAEARWAEYMVMMDVPESAAKAVEQLVTDREEKLFDLIQSSNWNDVSPQVMFEANHGTIAMWVEQGHLSQPLHIETVPPHELLITPGHMGYLDRFREKSVMSSTLPALFAGWPVNLGGPKLSEKIKKPGQVSMCSWGFWLDWSDPGNPVWRCEIVVDGERITPQEPLTLGPLAGACPLLVGRFNPIPGRPWGRGPARKSLPTMRVYNKIEEVILSGMDQALHNTIIYPDDGFLDFQSGIEVGRAYPASRGFTREQIYELNKGVNLDYGFFTEEAIEQRLRMAFYQDGPRQKGDTPPTASQWLDERRRVQQRLGKPSAPLWKELFLPFIQRVETIGVQTGRMTEAISHDGENINVSPISPLQKAQNQDKVMVSRSNLELAIGVAGEQAATVVDMVATFKNIVKASGDDLTVIRDEEQPVDQGTAAPGVAPGPPA